SPRSRSGRAVLEGCRVAEGRRRRGRHRVERAPRAAARPFRPSRGGVPPVRVAAALAPVRADPREDAEQVTQALPGEPLVVEDEWDGWAHIRTAYDYPGWVRVDALGGEANGA